MQKRRFGNTGLEVTVIGFGAMTIGGTFGERHCETLIGKLLASRPDRDDIVVFSKGGNNLADSCNANH